MIVVVVEEIAHILVRHRHPGRARRSGDPRREQIELIGGGTQPAMHRHHQARDLRLPGGQLLDLGERCAVSTGGVDEHIV